MEQDNSQFLIKQAVLNEKLSQNIIEQNYFKIDIPTKTISIELCPQIQAKACLEQGFFCLSLKDFFSCVKNKDLHHFYHILSDLEVGAEKITDPHWIKFPGSEVYFWVRALIKRVSNDQFLGIQLNITDLWNVESKILEDNIELEHIVNNVSDLIAKYNLNGEVIFASQSFADLFELSLKEMVGKNIFTLNRKLAHFDRNWFHSVLKPPYTSKRTICLNQGTPFERWIEWNNQAIFTGGEIKAIFSVGHDITDIIKANQKLTHDATHDKTTGLMNRHSIFDYLRAKAGHTKHMAALMLQIKNYQDIIDFYGVDVGDQLQQEIARILQDYEKYGCITARFATDRFVIVVPDYQSVTTVSYIKKRILTMTNKTFILGANHVFVNLNVGYAFYPEDTQDTTSLLMLSDMAVSETTLRGKKSMRFNQAMYERLKVNVNLAHDFKMALANQEIQLVYQKIVDHEQNIYILETLARWHHPTEGYISPQVFLNIADKAGLLEEFDLYVMDQALNHFAKLKQDPSYQSVKLSINITPSTLLSRLFPRSLRNLLNKYRTNPNELIIEIAENTFVHNMKECHQQIAQLKSIGVLIALDDFGSEYSSLAILDEVDIDIIKVDKAFISKLPKQGVLTILEMIRKIASLDKRLTILEGVETEEQVKHLKELGFSLFQGYFFDTPKPLF